MASAPTTVTIDVDLRYRYPRLAWIVRSRKAKIALGTLGTIVGVRLLRRAGLSDADASDLVKSALVLATAWIGGIAIEDRGPKYKIPNSNSEGDQHAAS